jgi:hypothetical protein
MPTLEDRMNYIQSQKLTNIDKRRQLITGGKKLEKILDNLFIIFILSAPFKISTPILST